MVERMYLEKILFSRFKSHEQVRAIRFTESWIRWKLLRPLCSRLHLLKSEAEIAKDIVAGQTSESMYVYYTGLEMGALLIVLHWVALIPSSEYIALTKIN